MNPKEIARDLLAFGSIPFFIIILARAAIQPYTEFVTQLLLAAAALLVLSLIFKRSDRYSARGLILLTFTSLFYMDRTFFSFALAVWLSIIFALGYLKVKKREIILGIVLGAVSSAISYYLTSLFF